VKKCGGSTQQGGILTNKEKLIKAIENYNNHHSFLENRTKILQKAFDEDTVIMDLSGLDYLMEDIEIIISLIFPKMTCEQIKEEVEYYLFETSPAITIDNKEWTLSSPKAFYNYLEANYS